MYLLIRSVAMFDVITFSTEISPLLENILYIVVLNNYIIFVCSCNALSLPKTDIIIYQMNKRFRM